jgi:hypothetical protein
MYYFNKYLKDQIQTWNKEVKTEQSEQLATPLIPFKMIKIQKQSYLSSRAICTCLFLSDVNNHKAPWMVGRTKRIKGTSNKWKS